MTDREFKHLKRKDLIEIIYQLQKNEQQLRTELESSQARLAEREMKISKVGSIAEAVVGLSGIFETAQAAADEYLARIHAMDTGELSANYAAMEAEARAEAEEILRKAQEEAQALKDKTQNEIALKWKYFYQQYDLAEARRKELP